MSITQLAGLNDERKMMQPIQQLALTTKSGIKLLRPQTTSLISYSISIWNYFKNVCFTTECWGFFKGKKLLIIFGIAHKIMGTGWVRMWRTWIHLHPMKIKKEEGGNWRLFWPWKKLRCRGSDTVDRDPIMGSGRGGGPGGREATSWFMIGPHRLIKNHDGIRSNDLLRGPIFYWKATPTPHPPITQPFHRCAPFVVF